MASSGEAESSGSVTEEFEYTHTCLSCETEGQKKKAVGYCINCREYLCQRCYDVHLIPLQMKRHTLVDEENMADIETADATSVTCSERCPNHQGEIINFHCPTHTFFGCQICFYKHQKECKDVLYIPEVCQNITESTQYQDFNKKIADIFNKGTQLKSEINTATETNNMCHEKAVSGIKAYKKELLDAIDKLERELLDKSDKIKQDRAAKLKALANKVNEVLAENQKITFKIEMLRNTRRHCDLYTAMVQLKDKLIGLEDNMRAAKSEKCTIHYEYIRNREFQETLTSPFALGKLCETGAIAHVEHLMSVSCKTGKDTSDSRLVGSVLLTDNTLCIADQSNEKVKIFDTIHNVVVAEIKTPPSLWGICKVTETQVAVATASEEKIVFIETKPSLSIDRELKVDGQCRGLGYSEGKLVVSYSGPHKVEIIDLQGTVLKKIETDDHGQSLFSGPHGLTVNQYNKLIYVSNYNHQNIVCMKFDGTVVAKYTDSELQYPWAVTHDMSGMVYVCGRSSNNVHQITEDCKKVKVFLTKTEGLNTPESIAYNERYGKIYIGQCNNDLKVFQLNFKQL